MANNVDVTAGSGTTFKTTDTAGVHTGHVNVDSSALPTGAATAAKQPALGTAGSASTDVITVQGIASGTAQPVSLASVPSHAVTNAGTFAVQVSSITAGDNNIGNVDVVTLPALPTGSNTIGTVNLSATDNTVLDNIEVGIDEVMVLIGNVAAIPTTNTLLGRLVDIEAAIVDASAASTVAIEPQGYETVAASVTLQILGTTGAIGDYLGHILIQPTTTSPGNVIVYDSDSVTVYTFPGGSLSVGSLVPFSVPITAKSVSGVWKITTGANVTVVAIGTFT